jgi:hypothetical protein
MKLFVLLISFFITVVSFDIDEIRILYKQANSSKENTLLLYDTLNSVSEKDGNVLMAYKGASIAMKGRFEKGVRQKSIIFKEGVSLVEAAIDKDPKNIEIRFVRLTIQQNSPKILKYKKNIDEDTGFILTNYNKIKSNKLKKHLKGYILNSNHFTEEEKNVISQS